MGRILPNLEHLGVVIVSELSMTAHVNSSGQGLFVPSTSTIACYVAVHSISMPHTHSFGRSYIVILTIVTASSQLFVAGLSAKRRLTDSPELVRSSSPPAARSGKKYQSGCTNELHWHTFPTA